MLIDPIFWAGFATAAGVYFAVGFGLGLSIVGGNLARFHAGGFQVSRMAVHVAKVTVLWPAIFLEI